MCVCVEAANLAIKLVGVVREVEDSRASVRLLRLRAPAHAYRALATAGWPAFGHVSTLRRVGALLGCLERSMSSEVGVPLEAGDSEATAPCMTSEIGALGGLFQGARSQGDQLFAPLHSEESRPTTSNSGIVERCAEDADPVAADEGPPAKKAKRMQTGLQQTSSRSVGQRLKESTLKESLQTPRNQSCRSPAVDYTSNVSPVSPRCLNSTQINTIRVIGQYLKNLGMQETVATLFAESGCRLEDSLAVRLRECALNGEWDLALHIVSKMTPYVSRASLVHIRVKLLEEKFVELLTKDQAVQALRLLSVDFPSDEGFASRRNFLATLLYVDPNSVDLYTKTGAHRNRQERAALVSDIQQLLPTSVMLPPSRLEQLLKQSWKMQARECYLHMAEQRGPSPDFILEDHQCSWEDFPLFTSQVLNNHQDEVWCASFSPCGKYLATGAKCGPTLVWKVVNGRAVEPYKSFGGSQNTAVISWSDDSALIAVAAAEDPNTDVHVYDVHRGSIYCTVDNRGNDNTVLSFFAGTHPYRLVCADQKGHFCQYVLSDNSAKPSGKFEGYRIRAIHCLKNGNVIAADTHNRVRCYRFSDDFDQTLIQEQSQIISFVIDKSERHLLIDTKLHGLRLWDLESGTLLRSYTGAPHHDFVVFSTFGGAEQNYVATGSVDEKVHIWSHKSDRLIAKLSGHTGKVNAVAWNAVYPQMLVSCSDDTTIRVWTPFNADSP
ncbi:WD repeat-containing protein 26 -like protein [Toxocara canis]|uniref:WD repeat-containing protein 26-like protein n=1 Tax=Toxocara canis TaxID=6265 RepID=A0A0B2VNH3_TOXCA|nr:WD repeat-containing protein 26 -like protein [Toxocara canis]